MNTPLLEKLKELKNEEMVWIIYLGIILLSFYSNKLERDYFINNNMNSKKEYQKTLIIIFTVLTIIYYSFVKSSWEDVKKLNPFDTSKKKELTKVVK